MSKTKIALIGLGALFLVGGVSFRDRIMAAFEGDETQVVGPEEPTLSRTQVLAMTPEQINNLDPNKRKAALQILLAELRLTADQAAEAERKLEESASNERETEPDPSRQPATFEAAVLFLQVGRPELAAQLRLVLASGDTLPEAQKVHLLEELNQEWNHFGPRHTHPRNPEQALSDVQVIIGRWNKILATNPDRARVQLTRWNTRLVFLQELVRIRRLLLPQ